MQDHNIAMSILYIELILLSNVEATLTQYSGFDVGVWM